jgi:tetratricopeptide (TPR) repeat protein
MGINTYEVMYIQAKDNYPYNVDECIEKLQYVIAADDEHAGAHCLMGRIYEEQLEDYRQAEYYYRMTLYLDRNYAPVYAHLANLLIHIGEMEEAHKIIDRGLRVKGIDTALLTYLKGVLYEKYEMYSTAINLYEEAKRYCLNNGFMHNMGEQIKRVKEKKALLKKLSKKKDKKNFNTKGLSQREAI